MMYSCLRLALALICSLNAAIICRCKILALLLRKRLLTFLLIDGNTLRVIPYLFMCLASTDWRLGCLNLSRDE